MLPNENERTTTALEDRVRELEAALAATKANEDALADRVMEKLLAARQADTVKLPAFEGLLVDSRVPPPPQGASPRMPESLDPTRRWLLLELWSELRLLPQMYFDPRYRLSRTAQFAGPVFIVGLLLCYFLFPNLVGIGPILERLVEITLGVLFYKVMAHETARYRDVLSYLDRYGYR